MRRRVDREDPGQAAIRRRCARAHQPDRDDLARRQRSRLSQRELRRAGGGLHGAIDGLVEGGVDLLLVETIFDTLNAKAALFAIDAYFDAHAIRLPLIVSGTITDVSGARFPARRPKRSGIRCATRARSPCSLPAKSVAGFAAEVIEAFLETFPETRNFVDDEERATVSSLRSLLRTPTTLV